MKPLYLSPTRYFKRKVFIMCNLITHSLALLNVKTLSEIQNSQLSIDQMYPSIDQTKL